MVWLPMTASTHDWSTFTGHRMSPSAVERAVSVAESAQDAWVERAAPGEPLPRGADASAWVAWLFARAPARSGVEGPSARELAQAAGYPAEVMGDAAYRWRRDLRQVARLYDARQLAPGSGPGNPDKTRGLYERALRLMPKSAAENVAPVVNRIAQSITDAKNL